MGPGVGVNGGRWIVSRHLGMKVGMDDTWRGGLRGIGARGWEESWDCVIKLSGYVGSSCV